MAGLCEGVNEPPGSLKAISRCFIGATYQLRTSWLQLYRMKGLGGETFKSVRNNRQWHPSCGGGTLKQYASSSGRVKVVSLFLSGLCAVKMCAAIASPARCEVRANRRFTMSELSEDFPQISRTLLYKVITEYLGYRKLSARWVPKLLSEEQKAQQLGAALSFLESYEREVTPPYAFFTPTSYQAPNSTIHTIPIFLIIRETDEQASRLRTQ
ncbi:hypothetical protein ANN_05639 [Periplaneta americana]|uniref:Uncharacterized protein n=1 Tax=Periplaneta americana TaxID=6978 RepID=A0ABQ8TDH0_PERAM|nr:hypothetical protein ANN_05639 [Periplaneta americana]